MKRTRSVGEWAKMLLKLSCLAAFAVVVYAPLLTIKEFNGHVEKLNMYLEMGDSVGMARELENLRYFYVLSEKWKVRWLADKYLFRDTLFYEAADTYLIEDWDAVINKSGLKDKLDDSRSYLYAAAKFRQAQAEYRATKLVEAPLNFIMTKVRDDFERDLRNCLEAASEYLECFDRVWNFDIVTNEEDAEEALTKPQILPGFILGPLKEEQEYGPGLPPGEYPDGSKLDEERPGSGGPRKRP
jgi:hypothetical protein